MSGVSQASLIQITLGPNSTGSITTSPTQASFTVVSGAAAQFGGLGNGVYGFFNGNIPVTSVNGPTYMLAPNSLPVTFNIGSDTLVGNFSLASFTQTTITVGSNNYVFDNFLGTYYVTSATSGFMATGFWVGSTAVADFQTINGAISSGEVVPTVPEPGTFAMVGSGLLALAGVLRRKL
jgi:hypothetical protein